MKIKRLLTNTLKYLSTHAILSYLFLILTTGFLQITAQEGMQIAPGSTISCPSGTKDTHSLHGMDFDSEAFLKKEATAEFIIIFGDGFEGNPEAQAAFKFATDIWAREIVSSVPIRIEAAFMNFPTNVTAEAGPTYQISDFVGAPIKSLLYPAALANAISNKILDPEQTSEARITYGNQVEFYFGIDGNTPSGKIDFVSTTLHEIAHGLGFGVGASVQNNVGSFTEFSRAPTVFANFIANTNNKAALELQNSGRELAEFLTGNNVQFNGGNATKANVGISPPLHAPSGFLPGSSISHWDEDTYPEGNPNSLMTPVRGTAESNFNIGNITRGLLSDIGWEINNTALFPIALGANTGDLEMNQNEIATQTFTVKNISNTPLNYNIALSQKNQNLNITLSNSENILLQPNEEKVVSVTLDSAGNTGVFKVVLDISTTVSQFVSQQNLNFVILNGTETAILNTIETLEANFAVVNEFNDSFRINNEGTRNLDFEIAIEGDEVSILTIQDLEGTIIPNDFSIIKYAINREGVPAGTYVSEIVITSNAENNTITRIPVTIIVRDTLNPPVFDISISNIIDLNIDVDSTTDIDLATVVFEIENSGEQPLEFNLEDSGTDLLQTELSFSNQNVLAPGAKVSRTLTVIPGIDAVGTNISSELVFESNDPLLAELRIPLNISLARERGRLELVADSAMSSNIVEEGSSASNILQYVNTGLAPINITDVASQTLGLVVEDWSSASGDAIVDVGEIVTLTTRFASLRRTASGFVSNSFRIVSDATTNDFFNNVYGSTLNVTEASGIVASEFLVSEVVNRNATNIENDLVSTQIFEITNVENTEIAYSISIEEDLNAIFSLDTTSGVLLPNETKQITVTTDASNLDLGKYLSQIVITNTENNTQEAIVNASLNIINQQGFLKLNPASSFVDFFDNFIAGFVEFKNDSRTAVEITNIDIQGNVPFKELFAVSDSGGEFPSELLVVQPGESVSLDFFYIPNSTADENIVVTSNAANNAFLIPVVFEFPEDLEPKVLGYQLIDVTTNQVVETFFEGATVDLADYENEVNLVAFTGAATPASIVFDYADRADFRIDNEAPFSLGRSFRDKLFPFNFSLGQQTITATPFSEIDGQGQAFSGASFDFNFVDSRLPFVTEFMLVNAENNENIRPIEEGEVLDLNNFDTRSFNIVAILDKPSTSVRFDLNGIKSFDLFAPFSAGGDFKGDFRALTLSEEENTLKAVSRSVVRRRGVVLGNPATIHFTIVPLEPIEKISNSEFFIPFAISPNPVINEAKFSLAADSNSTFKVVLSGLSNRIINSSGKVSIDKNGNGILNLQSLANGFYFITITDTSNGKIFRSKIIKR